MVANKELDRLKVVLVEKKRSSLWLSGQLGYAPTTVFNGVPIHRNLRWRNCLKWLNCWM